MRAKQLAERRQRAAEDAQRELEARCAACRRPLSEVDVVIEDFLVAGKCCSDGCLADLLERRANV